MDVGPDDTYNGNFGAALSGHRGNLQTAKSQPANTFPDSRPSLVGGVAFSSEQLALGGTMVVPSWPRSFSIRDAHPASQTFLGDANPGASTALPDWTGRLCQQLWSLLDAVIQLMSPDNRMSQSAAAGNIGRSKTEIRVNPIAVYGFVCSQLPDL